MRGGSCRCFMENEILPIFMYKKILQGSRKYLAKVVGASWSRLHVLSIYGVVETSTQVPNANWVNNTAWVSNANYLGKSAMLTGLTIQLGQ